MTCDRDVKFVGHVVTRGEMVTGIVCLVVLAFVAAVLLTVVIAGQMVGS